MSLSLKHFFIYFFYHLAVINCTIPDKNTKYQCGLPIIKNHVNQRVIPYNGYIGGNSIFLMLTLFFGFFLGLLGLGILKGLLGLCLSKSIGEFGLNFLVDLPKPLNQYRERKLRKYSVVHDVAGWPVHPETKKRTVRLLSCKAEFCLNVIFFLAYPLAVFTKLCALCCCIRNMRDEDEKLTCKAVNVIKFQRNKDSPGQYQDVYENPEKEKSDTEYVVNQMRISQISLRNM